MRRFVGILVTAALLGAARLPAVATTPAPLPTLAGRVGFSQGGGLPWESDAQLSADLDGMVSAGASWVGVDFSWASIQPSGPGTYDWWSTDRLIYAARARGLKVLGVPLNTPGWARAPGATGTAPPADPAQYATFASAAAQRYAPFGVHDWQIWNEPNIANFWSPAPDPAAYARLFIPAADAIHAADPSATVMTAGLSPAGDVAGYSISPFSYLSALYNLGVGPHLDAVAMHPYSFPYAPTTPAVWNPFFMLPWLHIVMAAHGDGAKQIWATEVGFGTGGDRYSVSEATQATRILQVLTAWQKFSFAGPVFLYQWRDLGTTTSVFDHMGLVRIDGTRKAAFNTVRKVLANGGAAPRSAPRATPAGACWATTRSALRAARLGSSAGIGCAAGS